MSTADKIKLTTNIANRAEADSPATQAAVAKAASQIPAAVAAAKAAGAIK